MNLAAGDCAVRCTSMAREGRGGYVFTLQMMMGSTLGERRGRGGEGRGKGGGVGGVDIATVHPSSSVE